VNPLTVGYPLGWFYPLHDQDPSRSLGPVWTVVLFVF